MNPALFFLCAILLATSAVGAEDYRVMRLEQDMRTLERHVETLERQVASLQQQLRRADPTYEPKADRQSAAGEEDRQWLSAAAWERVRPGMSELQVIEALGRPTALRPDPEGRRALLYTLEIGATGFLTGSISFRDGKVVEVQKPTLK